LSENLLTVHACSATLRLFLPAQTHGNGCVLWFLPPKTPRCFRFSLTPLFQESILMARKVLTFHPTSDRMVIDTGCPVFDSQCSHLTSGNHWGNCQFSTFVRPVSETESNGRTVPVGELFDFDMKSFTMMPQYVLAAIRAINRTVVVSEIRHHIDSDRPRHKIVHGYIVADAAERLIRVFQTTDGPLSERILSSVLPYVADLDAAQQAA
jgi:hypothetical protein